MSSCPASLRRFSSGTKFTEWNSTSGSTGDQLYHALPPPNSFLPHLPFSSTTYYIPTWSVWLSYLLLQNTAIFLLPPFNFHSLCSTILYFKIDDFTFSSFELWKKEIVWHASLPHAPPPPQNWQESVPKRIISTASTASCSHRWFSQAAALSPPFFKHSCLWRNATTIWDAEGHMSAILMEDDELVQIHSVRIPENLGRTHLDPKSKKNAFCFLQWAG